MLSPGAYVIHLNERSQIRFGSRNVALTRCAQQVEEVRHGGQFRELENQLTAFNTCVYTGESSHRADALIWILTELFPGLVQPLKVPAKASAPAIRTGINR